MFGQSSDDDEYWGFGGRQEETSYNDSCYYERRQVENLKSLLGQACERLNQIDKHYQGVGHPSFANLKKWHTNWLIEQEKLKAEAEAKRLRHERAVQLFNTKPMGQMTQDERRLLQSEGIH